MAHAKLVVIAECIVIPDMHPVVHEVFYIGIAGQEPEQFVDHALQKYFFGRQQGKALRQIEAHLMSEDAFGTGAGTVAAHDAFGLDPAQQIEVLFHRSSLIDIFPLK